MDERMERGMMRKDTLKPVFEDVSPPSDPRLPSAVKIFIVLACLLWAPVFWLIERIEGVKK